MNDKLEQFQRSASQRLASVGSKPPVVEQLDEAVCPSFDYLRGIRERAENIEFRREREGDSIAFPYNWLGPKRYHASSGIMLLFVGSELYLVTLHGRNLNRVNEAGISLYECGILRNRVTCVRELNREDSELLPAEECVVERIDIRGVTPHEASQAFGMA